MRKSLTLLSGLFVLLFSFSSCLEEESVTTFDPGPEPELGEATGTMSYRGVESPIVAVYDMDGAASAMGESNTSDYVTLIISNRNMKGANDRLTQTADVLILNIVKDGDLPGTYRVADWNNPDPSVQFFSNICTGMNFATGQVDEDEGMETGTTTILANDDGTYTIDFDHVTYGRNVVSGSWTGDLTVARN